MEIVLIGRSNVGKSSVIRQLTGRKVPIGKRPGVTRKINRYQMGDLIIVDMPGFGFMSGVSRSRQEKTKTEIVSYIENNRSKIALPMEVVDARSFHEIAERWENRGQIPVDVEMFSFLKELGLNPILVVNKIDLIYPEERDEVLDDISLRVGLTPPWRQWSDVIVPISAKTGEDVAKLKRLVKGRINEFGKGRLSSQLR